MTNKRKFEKDFEVVVEPVEVAVLKPAAEPEPEAVVVVGNSATIKMTQRVILSAAFVDNFDNPAPIIEPATWVITDPTVLKAIVSADGRVGDIRPLKVGTTTVTVSAGGAYDTPLTAAFDITVVEGLATKVKLTSAAPEDWHN